MPVFRWGRAWGGLDNLEHELDRLLQSVNVAMGGARLGRQHPAVNIYELNDSYLITAELAGVQVENLDISVANGLLTLSGKRLPHANVAEDRYRRRECTVGDWERSFSLPERIVEEELSAEFVDGILRVTLPKAPESSPRVIQIQTDRNDQTAMPATRRLNITDGKEATDD